MKYKYIIFCSVFNERDANIDMKDPNGGDYDSENYFDDKVLVKNFTDKELESFCNDSNHRVKMVKVVAPIKPELSDCETFNKLKMAISRRTLIEQRALFNELKQLLS